MGQKTQVLDKKWLYHDSKNWSKLHWAWFLISKKTHGMLGPILFKVCSQQFAVLRLKTVGIKLFFMMRLIGFFVYFTGHDFLFPEPIFF